MLPHASFGFNPYKATYQPDLNKYSYPTARHFATNIASSPNAKLFFEGRIGGKLTTAVVDPATSKTIGAENNTVWIHADKMRHIRKKHEDITSADLAKIQDIVEKGEVITNPKGFSDFLLFKKIQNKEYTVPVSVVKNGVNVNTFFEANLDYREHIIKIGGKVMKKEEN